MEKQHQNRPKPHLAGKDLSRSCFFHYLSHLQDLSYHFAKFEFMLKIRNAHKMVNLELDFLSQATLLDKILIKRARLDGNGKNIIKIIYIYIFLRFFILFIFRERG